MMLRRYKYVVIVHILYIEHLIVLNVYIVIIMMYFSLNDLTAIMRESFL